MSTRCQIRIVRYGYPLNLYHHCDGYFSGVGAELQQLLQKYIGDRESLDSWDERAFVREVLDDKRYEITFERHADIEYFYLIDFDRHEFLAFSTDAVEPWARTDDDDFDCTKPVYMQLPRFNEKRDLLNDSMED